MTDDTTSVLGVPCFHWVPQSGPRNFGDELGPWIVETLLAQAGVGAVRPRDVRGRLLSVGSVLHFASPTDTVWGSGVNGKVWSQTFPLTIDVRAVRGPFTRAVLMARGIPVPPVYGDPALLIRRMLPDLPVSAEGETLVVPNLNDLEQFDADDIMSPLEPPLSVVESIARARFVVASSLHALIIADALGVPSRPLISAAEHPFKYYDYYAGTGRAQVTFARSVEHALDLGPVEKAEVDEDALVAAFPWDLWGADAPRGKEAAQSRARHQRLDAVTLMSDAQHERDRLGAALNGSKPRGDHEDPTLRRLRELQSNDLPLSGLTREEARALGRTLPHLRRKGVMDAPIMSVVVAVRDDAPALSQTLESLLVQGLTELEVIVVDDHSLDGSARIAADLASRDDRVRLVNAVSAGRGNAWNVGADHARGQYIMFCDGRTLFPPEACGAIAGTFEDVDVDIAVGGFLRFRADETWPAAGTGDDFPVDARFTVREMPALLGDREPRNKAFRRSFWESRGLRFPADGEAVGATVVSALARARGITHIKGTTSLRRDITGPTSDGGDARDALAGLAAERSAAQTVAAIGVPDVVAWYGEGLYEGPVFTALRRYLEAGGDQAPDDEAAAIVDRVLGTVPLPRDRVNPLHRLVLERTREGDLTSARSALREAQGVVVQTVRVLEQADLLVVQGLCAAPAEEAPVPVLCGDDLTEALLPTELDVSREGDRWRFRATYAAGSLPLERALFAALRLPSGLLLPAPVPATGLPRYRPKNAFLCEDVSGNLVVRRRRHWMVRGARRAARLAQASLRRRLRFR
ncbi:glycosyltransferase [Microbacterium album]|nr:glycosyltransferase [Microbacterium album]